MIAIIDYDAGNLRSVEKALISLGEAPVITRDGGDHTGCGQGHPAGGGFVWRCHGTPAPVRPGGCDS